MQQNIRHESLALLLSWYQEMGVDAALGEAPVDWLARDAGVAPGAAMREALVAELRGTGGASRSAAGAATDVGRRSLLPSDLMPSGSKPTGRQPAAGRPSMPGQAPSRGVPPRPNFPSAAPPEAASAARAAAAKAKSLSDLRKSLESFDGCALKATAKNLCFYRGAEQASVMVIGEAPGRDEDIEGKPFVGRAGQLLDKMLAAIGLDETAVHITNVVYWRPPGNRTPNPQETLICRPFLERQIELVEPQMILLLGGAAAKSVLDLRDGIMKLRGKWRPLKIGEREVKAIATLHPAYLLRTPIAKRLAWRDLQKLQAELV